MKYPTFLIKHKFSNSRILCICNIMLNHLSLHFSLRTIWVASNLTRLIKSFETYYSWIVFMDGILSNCNSTFSFFFSCTQSISNNEYCQFKILKDMRKPIGFHEFQVDGKVWIGNGTRSAFLFLRLAGRAVCGWRGCVWRGCVGGGSLREFWVCEGSSHRKGYHGIICIQTTSGQLQSSLTWRKTVRRNTHSCLGKRSKAYWLEILLHKELAE